MSNWTDFQMSDIPQRTRDILAERARTQAVTKYGPSARSLVERAIAAVAGGHVALAGRNIGRVQDNGLWLAVDLEYCGHCGAQDPRAVCWHKLAVAFADLLARHLPDDAEPQAVERAAGQGTGTTAGAGVAGLGHGRYSGVPLRHVKPLGRRAGKPGHCPRCGAFLDSSGACNKCGAA